jgi:hypothetical protein
VVYPHIVSTEVDVFIGKALDGPPASADDLVGLDVVWAECGYRRLPAAASSKFSAV